MIGILEQIEGDFLDYALDDYAGVWLVFSYAHELLPSADDAVVRWIVLAVLYDLSNVELVQAGDWGEDGFLEWDLSPNEVIHHIHQELDLLGREPDIGEIAWFAVTEKGRTIRAGDRSS